MPTTKTQAEKFKDAAKAADADQDEVAFKKRLKKIARPPTARPKPSDK